MELKTISEHGILPVENTGNIQNSQLYAYQEGGLEASHFIGVDWVVRENLAIYVEPKLNEQASQTNYLQMLFDALKHPNVGEHTSDLFEIKFDDTPIEIEQKQDLLTPLLVVHFLGLVKQIVKKGLKKSYYSVEQNLTAKMKGKVLVNQTIKKNIVKNDILKTYCSFDEFGFNSLENRLLKKTLLFVQRYLPTISQIQKSNEFITNTFAYILPAFENVSEEIELHEIKNSKFNAFYKEYAEAIRLAKLILKRFGYNITNTKTTETGKLKTPPFWIDMSKLFELYVLGLLKDRFGNKIIFQQQANYGNPDFLLKDPKMIIDSKYKKDYLKEDYVIEDVRQLSGYARDIGVLDKLKSYDKENIDATEIIPCLIIHYDKDLISQEEYKNYQIDLEKKIPITQFVKFYKLAVKLPKIN